MCTGPCLVGFRRNSVILPQRALGEDDQRGRESPMRDDLWTSCLAQRPPLMRRRPWTGCAENSPLFKSLSLIWPSSRTRDSAHGGGQARLSTSTGFNNRISDTRPVRDVHNRTTHTGSDRHMSSNVLRDVLPGVSMKESPRSTERSHRISHSKLSPVFSTSRKSSLGRRA